MSRDDHTVLAMYSADTTKAAMTSLHCDLLGRPRCRSTSRTRGLNSRRGIPTLFREASRGGSRGAKPRSRSGTCQTRPSSEVQLRAFKDEQVAADEAVAFTKEATPAVECNSKDAVGANICASGFVCDLLDDAVNDFADDLMHDVDDSYPNPQKSEAPTDAHTVLDAPKVARKSKDAAGVNLCANGFVCELLDDAVNDFADDLVHDVDESYPSPPTSQAPAAHTVLNAVEPTIKEYEDEEDDMWAAANMITETAAQQAVDNNMEKVSEKDTDSTQDSGKGVDDYEEVYSLASGEPQDEEVDEEIEAAAFTKMAMSMAKDAVDKASLPEQQDVIQDDMHSKSELAFDFVCGVVDGAICGAAETAWQAADRAEQVVDEPPTEMCVEEARQKARDILLKTALSGELESKLMSMKNTKVQKEVPVDVEALRQEAKQTMLKAAKSGMLEQLMKKSREKSQEPAMDEDSLRRQAKATLFQAAKNGKLEEIIRKRKEQKQQEANMDDESLRQHAKQTLFQAARNGKLEQILLERRKQKSKSNVEEVDDLRTKLKACLLQAAESGKLEESLTRRRLEKQKDVGGEEDEPRVVEPPAKEPQVDDLRAQARRTLMEAVNNGKLEQYLTAKAKAKQEKENSTWTVQSLKQSLRQTLTQAAQSGALPKILNKAKRNRQPEEAKADSIEALRLAARNTLIKAVQTDRLDEAVDHAVKARELKQLRIQARNTLLQAVDGGRLEEAIMAAKKGKEVANLKRTAAETLFKAAQCGRLEEAFHKVRMQNLEDAESDDESDADAEELRSCARETLLEATKNGQLEQVLSRMNKARHVSTLRSQVRTTLMKATEGNALQKAIMKVRAKKAEEEAQKAEEEAKKKAAAEAKQLEVQELRRQVKATIQQGVADGRLQAALMQLKAKRAEQESAPAADDLASLRLQAKATLAEAAANGKLAEKLEMIKQKKKAAELQQLKIKAREALLQGFAKAQAEKVNKKAEVQELKIKAREALLKVAQSGGFAQAVDKANQAKQIPLIRQQARQTLAQAAADGRLAQAIDKICKKRENENLREKARGTLLKAVKENSLAAAIDKVKKARELESVKEKARDALMQAFENGAAAKVLNRRQVAEVEEEPSEESLKMIARDALLKASQNGGFERAMEQIQRMRQEREENAELEDLRSFARNTLTQAYTSGSLESAFELIRRKRQHEAEQQEAAALKKRVRAKLMEATRSGRLSNVFQAVFNEGRKEKKAEPTRVEQTFNIQLPAEPKTFSMVVEPEHFQLTPPASPATQARAPKTNEMESGESTPTTGRSLQHSKSKRRIIGGVSRSSSSVRLEEVRMPSSSRSGRSTISKKEDKEVDWSTCVKAFGAPAFDRPTSKTSARLRKAVSMSALAMDLGVDAAPSAPPAPNPFYGSPDVMSSSSASFSPFAPIRFTTPSSPLDKKRCSSLGALKSSKSKASGLLPSLPDMQTSTEKIAWSMGITKTSSKWSPTVDWRGAGAVF